MNFFQQKDTMSVDASRKTRRPIVMTILVRMIFFIIVACLPTNLVAVEIVQDKPVNARRLQVEGARLQIKGDLDGALIKYKESLALQPNEHMEDLVGQLEKKIRKNVIKEDVSSLATEKEMSNFAHEQNQNQDVKLINKQQGKTFDDTINGRLPDEKTHSSILKKVSKPQIMSEVEGHMDSLLILLDNDEENLLSELK